MQLQRRYKLTPPAFNKLPVAMDSTLQGGTGNVCLGAFVLDFVRVCVSSWPYNSTLLIQTQYASINCSEPQQTYHTANKS